MSATVTTITPYAAHLLVNAALREAGVAKVIPPQMMYNYTTGRLNKNKLPLIACVDGRITTDGLATWLAKYLVKQGAQLTVADPEQAEFDRSEA